MIQEGHCAKRLKETCYNSKSITVADIDMYCDTKDFGRGNQRACFTFLCFLSFLF